MVIWRVDMIALVLAPSHGNNVAIFYFTHRQAAHCKCRNNNNNEEESIILKVFLKEMTNAKVKRSFSLKEINLLNRHKIS